MVPFVKVGGRTRPWCRLFVLMAILGLHRASPIRAPLKSGKKSPMAPRAILIIAVGPVRVVTRLTLGRVRIIELYLRPRRSGTVKRGSGVKVFLRLAFRLLRPINMLFMARLTRRVSF